MAASCLNVVKQMNKSLVKGKVEKLEGAEPRLSVPPDCFLMSLKKILQIHNVKCSSEHGNSLCLKQCA